MSTADAPICLAFARLITLWRALRLPPLNQLPGCWEHTVNEQWAFSFNGHMEPRPCAEGVTVPPIHAAVWFNGWPAGLLGPYGGHIAAGECANEDAFLAALEAAIASVS